MPELPEVETVVLQLRSKVIGKKIENIFTNYYTERNFQCVGGIGIRDLINRKIEKIERKGKNILFYIGEYILLIHQKMSGPLIYDKFYLDKEKVYLGEEYQKHIHFCLFFDDFALALYDVRVFSKIMIGSREKIISSFKIGIDALDNKLSDKLFYSLLLKRKMKIKPFLLDQSNIAGVGNIYADESLFCAGIHPETISCKISYEKSKELLKCILKILKQTIKLKGSSIKDYVGIDGEGGSFALKHNVYQREGQKCFKCDSIIKKIKISGRYSRYCPKCQKWLK